METEKVYDDSSHMYYQWSILNNEWFPLAFYRYTSKFNYQYSYVNKNDNFLTKTNTRYIIQKYINNQNHVNGIRIIFKYK